MSAAKAQIINSDPRQLRQIRSIRLSRLVCDNGDNIESIQIRAMEVPDFETNPRVPCSGRALPRLDLRHWRESPKGEYYESTNNKETVLIEETDNLETNLQNPEDTNKVIFQEKPNKEEEEIKVDYHVIKVDNKPVLIDSIGKIIDDLKQNNRTKPLPPILEEEDTILNIS